MQKLRKLSLISLALGAICSAYADALFFESVDFAGNAAARSNWLAATGIATPDFMEDFESIAVGTNVNGLPLTGGAVFTHPSGNAVVQSSPGFFGTSNPVGTRSLALAEGATNPVTITFAAPVDYVGGLEIDKPEGLLEVYFTDTTSETYNLANTLATGDSAQFWGVYRNDMPQITMVQLRGSGGDGEWGIDNIEFGVVPEPGTFLAIGAGLALLALRRKR